MAKGPAVLYGSVPAVGYVGSAGGTAAILGIAVAGLVLYALVRPLEQQSLTVQAPAGRASSGSVPASSHAAAHTALQYTGNTILPPLQATTNQPAGTTWTVTRGQTLWYIAGQVYHQPGWWPALWAANLATVTNPDVILPGQVLRIPPATVAQAAVAAYMQAGQGAAGARAAQRVTG